MGMQHFRVSLASVQKTVQKVGGFIILSYYLWAESS